MKEKEAFCLLDFISSFSCVCARCNRDQEIKRAAIRNEEEEEGSYYNEKRSCWGYRVCVSECGCVSSSLFF